MWYRLYLERADGVLHVLHCRPGQLPLIAPKGLHRLILDLQIDDE